MWWVLRHRVDIENQLLLQHQLKFMNKPARHSQKNMHSMLLQKRFGFDYFSLIKWSLFICYFHQGRTSSATSTWTKSRSTSVTTQRIRKKCTRCKQSSRLFSSYLLYFLSDKLYLCKKRMQPAVILIWLKLIRDHKRRNKKYQRRWLFHYYRHRSFSYIWLLDANSVFFSCDY